MSTFDSTKTLLSDLLTKVVKGKLQLPDFQRGWVWDDEHIQSLLVSIARSFPIGAVMLLETGGDTRFQVRAVEGVDLPPNTNPEELILDGQQRLTSLTQVLKLDKPVATRDAKKRELKLHYYFDIEKALLGPQVLEDAIVTVDEQRIQRENFGRTVVLDLSTRKKEIDAFHFPCSQILNSDDWGAGLVGACPRQARPVHEVPTTGRGAVSQLCAAGHQPEEGDLEGGRLPRVRESKHRRRSAVGLRAHHGHVGGRWLQPARRLVRREGQERATCSPRQEADAS
jgi:hypothetical protein